MMKFDAPLLLSFHCNPRSRNGIIWWFETDGPWSPEGEAVQEFFPGMTRSKWGPTDRVVGCSAKT